MEKFESFPQEKNLLESFMPGEEVTVRKQVRINFGPNGAMTLPEGVKLIFLHGGTKRKDQPAREDEWIVVKADNGIVVKIPHTEAEKIIVE